MKKTLIATVLVAVATVFTVTVSCKKENSKIPESIDELWGTTWTANIAGELASKMDLDNKPVICSVSFVNVDSVTLTYVFTSDPSLNSTSTLKGATYIIPNFFVIYDDDPQYHFCTFKDNFMLLNILTDEDDDDYDQIVNNILFYKVK